jgi:hypothetical protein
VAVPEKLSSGVNVKLPFVLTTALPLLDCVTTVAVRGWFSASVSFASKPVAAGTVRGVSSVAE